MAEQLSGTVLVDDAVALLVVVGEIDISTAPQFQALPDEAVAVGAPQLTIDMAGVGFLGAHGLAALVSAARRVAGTGATLGVRAASPRIYRLFDITGLTEILGVEPPPPDFPLVGALAGAAAIPLTLDVLNAALKLVVTMAQAVIIGADGVSITLPRAGRWGTVAASNDVVREMDHDQYDTGQGPCLDAATQGERFHIESLRGEARWPAFVPRARARGIESILSTPLVSATRPIGALNIYSRSVGAFAVHEKHWADQFATETATVISSVQRDTSSDALTDQIQQALASREVIALAQGIVMQREWVSPRAAEAFLRNISRRTGTPLREICERLVNRHGARAPQARDGEDQGWPRGRLLPGQAPESSPAERACRDEP